MKRPWLWWAAVSLWLATAATYAMGAESSAAIEFGDVRFNVSQLLLLFAIGAAWGDMRRGQSDQARRIERLEKRFDDRG